MNDRPRNQSTNDNNSEIKADVLSCASRAHCMSISMSFCALAIKAFAINTRESLAGSLFLTECRVYSISELQFYWRIYLA